MRRVQWVAAALAMAVALAAAGGRPALAAPVSLGGYVAGQGGRPLAGAEVELYASGYGVVASGRTDGSGSFHLHAPVAAASYWVRVWAPGHRVAEAPWVPGAQQEPFLALALAPLTGVWSVRVAAAPDGTPVAGATVELLRAGEGLVSRAATSASGRADLAAPSGDGYSLRVAAPGFRPHVQPLPELRGGTTAVVAVELQPLAGQVTGQVVDATSRQPVLGARVQVLRQGYGVVAELAAGPDGAFAAQLPAVAGAEYQVRATAPGYGAALTPAFALAGGRRQDFSGEGQLALAPAFAQLTGRLLDPDGNPVEGAEVALIRQSLGVVATATTGAGGTFRFDRLPPASGAVWRVRYVPRDSAWRTADTGWLALTPGRTVEVAIQSLRGSLDQYGDGALQGLVQTPSGRPVEGAAVELVREGAGVVATAVTGPEGRFRFTGVVANRGRTQRAQPANGYYVRVAAPGFRTAEVGVEAPLDVVTNQETAVNVTLYPATVDLTGRVLDGDGQPVAGAAVRLYAEGDPEPQVASAGSDGRFRLTGLDATRRYWIAAAAPGYLPTVAPVASGGWIVPDAAAGAAVDVVLRAAAATLEGTVTDPDGAPVDGARIRLALPEGDTPWQGLPPAHTAATSDGGHFRLADVAPGVPLLLTVQGEGTLPSALGRDGAALPVLELRPGERRTVRVQVHQATGSLVGQVLAVTGAPLPGARVELVREGSGVVATTFAGNLGQYRFDGVPAGHRYLVRLAIPGYAWRTAGHAGLPPLIDLAPGEVRAVHLVAVSLACAYPGQGGDPGCDPSASPPSP